ncbi:MAG: CotH kinase family protein [Pseudomonadota bacterium]|nr:CotH kinase family protein [Pseudomonadota bacterium]
MLCLLVAACVDGSLVVGPDGDPTLPPDTDEPIEHIGDTGRGDDTGGDDTTEVETWPQACPDLYDPDLLPVFALEFSPEAWSGIRSDCNNGAQTYRPVELTYEGETVAAMARLKGNWSWSCDKLQFVVSFNEEDPAGRFHGQRKLMFDAPWYDRTFLHERLAFPLFAARGLPYSCVNNAKLVVNGEYYGLYANLERIDEEYLERHFEESDGNLYQGGSELKTNETLADTSRLEALRAATTVAEIDALVDLDQAVAEWATEAMIPALDNYWAGVEINYYLYDHPSRGFLYLPYDLDISFGDAAYTSGELIWPGAATVDPLTYEHYGWQKEALVELVLSDPVWCERFVEELVLARSVFSPEALAAQVDAWDAQVGEALADDAHKPFSTADHAAAVAQLKLFLDTRAAFVDDWIAQGGHCPASW